MMRTRYEVLIAPVLLLLACALWIPNLNHTMTGDEAITIMTYATRLPIALIDYSEPNNHILHTALVWVMLQVFPHAPLFARLPALSASLMGIALMYRLSRAYLPIIPSLLAAAWLMLTPDYSAYAILARGYSLTMLSALALWWWGIEHPRPRLVMLVTFLMVLTLPTMGLLVIATFVWAWRWNRRLLMPLMVGSVVASLFYLPSVWFGLLQQHVNAYGYSDPVLLMTHVSLIAWSPMLLVICVASGIMQQQTHCPTFKPSRRAWIIMVIGVALILSYAVWLLTGKLVYDRNTLYLLPFFIMPSVSGLWQRLGVRGVAIACVVLSAQLPTVRHQIKPNEVDAILAQLGDIPADTALVMGCCADLPVRYHASDHPSLNWHNKDRVWVIRGITPLPDVLNRHGFEAMTCHYLTTWGTEIVYECKSMK